MKVSSLNTINSFLVITFTDMVNQKSAAHRSPFTYLISLMLTTDAKNFVAEKMPEIQKFKIDSLRNSSENVTTKFLVTNQMFDCSFYRPGVKTAGVLRESVLHRYAQYCNLVRGRLLIDQ